MEFTLEMVEQILNQVHTAENLWLVKLTKRDQGFYVILLQRDDGDLSIHEVPDTKKFLEEVSDEYNRLRNLNDGYKSSVEEDQGYAVDNVLSDYETINEILWG